MKRKIALISEHAAPLGTLGSVDCGGQNVYVGHVARQLAIMGHEVDVYTRRDCANLPDVLAWDEGVRVHYVTAGPTQFVRKEDLLPHMDEFYQVLLKSFRRNRHAPDVVHANFFMSGLVASQLKRALGIPYVITFHALGRVRRIHQREADGFPDSRGEIEETLVRDADAVVAECPQDQLDLIEHYHADAHRLAMIPCGFDPEELYPTGKRESRRLLGLDNDEMIILHLGRMVPRKGVETAIHGFARFLAKEKGTRARLLIVGGESETPDPRATPEIGRLIDVAQRAGVAENVTFTGRRDRNVLRHYYSAADAFVTVPWYEPFGITPLEAMACGTPVVGSNVGGIKFSVRDGETGCLVPPRDPDALGNALALLSRNPHLRESMGRRGWERVHNEFTWKKIARELSDLYEDTVIARIRGLSSAREVSVQRTQKSLVILEDMRSCGT